MGTFLLFMFLVLSVGVMLLVSLFRGITSFIFGKNSSSSGFGSAGGGSNTDNGDSFQTNKKVFSKDEGEYVKYEEIKE